jgi:UDPglucose--hexose-1-phosphate uridylyltransferase
MLKSEIRKAYFLDKYVIIASGRALRPRDILRPADKSAEESCVICPKNIEDDLKLKEFGSENGSWMVSAIRNKYPAVSIDNPKAYGIQEVIIDTPSHSTEFSDLPEEHIKLYLKVMSDRLKKISTNKKIQYILIFKNKGLESGASLMHAHSQIFATAILPFEVREELLSAEKAKKKWDICPYCKTFMEELNSDRAIFQDEYAGVIAPFASEFHYEAWIFTKRHTDNISTLNKKEIASIAHFLKLITRKLSLRNIDYNFFMHQAVSCKDQHFHIKVEPRDKNIWAGIELGSGFIINTVAPEQAAQFYKI